MKLLTMLMLLPQEADEGRLINLEDVQPSDEARNLARRTDKDPRMVELILRESVDVVRAKPGVIIARHRLGIVSANAGIDQSNIDHREGECALLLPEDPDKSAQQLREVLQQRTGDDEEASRRDRSQWANRWKTVCYSLVPHFPTMRLAAIRDSICS